MMPMVASRVSIELSSPSPGPTVETIVPIADDKARCDCLSLAPEPSNGALEKHFGEWMKNFGQSRGYKSVASLLLSWEDSELNENGKLDQEVDELGDVLRQKYHFTVSKKRIPKKKPAHWSTLNQVIPFLLENDSNNALLIIYYAGHGFRGASHDKFELARTSAEDQMRREVNTVLWDEIEQQLFKTAADLLVIFDCCFAGDLATQRGASPGKIFSFIGSTGDNQTARGPGPRSFTTALTYALRKLADRAEGFTTQELLTEIRSAPEFRNTTQQPVDGFRGKIQSHRQLRIRPLPNIETANQTVEVTKNPAGTRVDEIQYLLRLNFAFKESPNEQNIADFATDLARLIQSSQSPVRNVTWGMLAKRKKRVYWPKFQDAVTKVIGRRRLSSLSRRERPTLSPSPVERLYPGVETAWRDDDSTAVDDSQLAVSDLDGKSTSAAATQGISFATSRQPRSRSKKLVGARVAKNKHRTQKVRRSQRTRSSTMRPG